MSELNKDDELVISLNSGLFREKFYLRLNRKREIPRAGTGLGPEPVGLGSILGLHYISPKPGKSPGLTKLVRPDTRKLPKIDFL